MMQQLRSVKKDLSRCFKTLLRTQNIITTQRLNQVKESNFCIAGCLKTRVSAYMN